MNATAYLITKCSEFGRRQIFGPYSTAQALRERGRLYEAMRSTSEIANGKMMNQAEVDVAFTTGHFTRID